MSSDLPATQSTGALQAARQNTVRGLLSTDAFKKRFEAALGSRAPQFIASVCSVASSPALAKAEPTSVIAAAFIAATLDLPINPSLGFAHIVAYRNGGPDQPAIAQFQIGYKGYIQLALRTGKYRTLNDFVVYEGQLTSFNEMTGELEFDPKAKKSDAVIGYGFFFELINGFRKMQYWPREKIEAHAKKYSKSFGKAGSPWKTEFDAMALKTVISTTLRKYGLLSVEMQGAIECDGTARADIDAMPIYPDSTSSQLGAGGDPDGALIPAGGESDELGAPPKA